MRVGIIEICEQSHYLAASVIAKIYASDEDNKVYFYLDSNIFNKNNPKDLPKNVELVIKPLDQDWEVFIQGVNSLALDVLHINTVSKYFHKISSIPFKAKKISFSVHNVEDFFDNDIIKRTKKWWFSIKKAVLDQHFKIIYINTVLFIKSFWRQYYKDKFITNLIRKNYFLVVYSQGQANYLANFVDKKNIIVLPMAIYEPHKEILINEKKTFRITIPGVVSSDKRDYLGLLLALERNLAIKEKFTWDFLGFIAENETETLEKMKSLIAHNVDIQYYPNFISEEEFNIKAKQADIILGNLKTELNPFQKYGQTKESTTIFHMIKYAKIGFLPKDYQTDDHFKSSYITFYDYDDLIKSLVILSEDKHRLKILNSKALELSEKFTAKTVFERDLKPFILE